MKYGYARISTIDQNADMQLKALQRVGCHKIFKDEATGATTTKRPALLRCLKTLQDGDTLTVWKINRLASNLHDLVSMIEDFDKRSVNFRSLTEEINRVWLLYDDVEVAENQHHRGMSGLWLALK